MKFVTFLAGEQAIREISKNLLKKKLILFGQPVISCEVLKTEDSSDWTGMFQGLISGLVVGKLNFKEFAKNSMSEEDYKDVDKAVKEFIGQEEWTRIDAEVEENALLLREP